MTPSAAIRVVVAAIRVVVAVICARVELVALVPRRRAPRGSIFTPRHRDSLPLSYQRR
jgi:hypothetical protein